MITRSSSCCSALRGLESDFAQKLVSFESQLESEQTAITKLRTTQTSEFEAAEERRAALAKDRLDAAGKELERIQVTAKEQVDERVAEIRRMEQESAQLVGAIGLAGTAERYGEEVDEQKKNADTWRLATVVLALLAVGGVISQ